MTEYQKEGMFAGATHSGKRCGHMYRSGPRGQLQVYKFGTGWEDAIGRTWLDVEEIGPETFGPKRTFNRSDLALIAILAGALVAYFVFTLRG